jgi:phosphoribosylanthranilate isomerase
MNLRSLKNMPDTTHRSEAIAPPVFLSGATRSSPYVKICGVTNPEDAFAAIAAGADALGFNLFPDSKRFVDLDAAHDWISALPAQIARVAVGVNPEPAAAEVWLAGNLFHALQLHGQGWYGFTKRLVRSGKPLIAAIQVRTDSGQAIDLDWFNGFAVMFDGYRDGDFGGTGETFPWTVLERVKIDKPLILAGGLRPENVQRAIKMVNPYAVDVATGVESRPGKKDHAKISDFIAAVRGGW